MVLSGKKKKKKRNRPKCPTIALVKKKTKTQQGWVSHHQQVSASQSQDDITLTTIRSLIWEILLSEPEPVTTWQC